MTRILLSALLFLVATPAESVGPTPDLYKSMEVQDARGKALPQTHALEDAEGRTRSLTEWMNNGKPTLLTFNYLGCPMLCGLQQEGLAQSISELALKAGQDFHIVTVSIDPDETVQAMSQAEQRLSSKISSEWTVLRASQSAIDNLTQTAGFPFKWVEETKQFAHPAATYVLTDTGTISQFFTAVRPNSRDLNYALVEASNGTVGSLLDQITLTCLQYDLSSNTYVARNVMQAGGYVILGGVVMLLFALWRRELPRWR